MSYLAQDGVVDWFIGRRFTEEFVGKTIELTVLKGRIAAAWPASRVDYPIEAAIKITRGVADALSDFNKQVSKLSAGDVSLAGMRALATVEMVEYARKIGPCISNAKRAGLQTAKCPTLRSATLTAITNIIKHYGTLTKKQYELDNNILLAIKEALAFVGEIVVKIGQGIKDNFPKVPGFGGLVELIKWGSIGGGLFILYWYVLRPADKRQKKRAIAS